MKFRLKTCRKRHWGRGSRPALRSIISCDSTRWIRGVLVSPSMTAFSSRPSFSMLANSFRTYRSPIRPLRSSQT